MKIVPKNKPKYYEIRKWVCRLLVNMARKIEPRSEEVAAFHMQQMHDLMITGRSVVRIDPFTTQWPPVD